MAFPVTLNGRTYTLTDFEGTNYVDGLPDAFEDFVTHAGDIYNSTSTTSNSIGTGSKTFTVEANKPYQAGTPLRIADAAAPSTNFLDTVVTSYSGTTLVVNSIGYGGSGTKTSWTVNIGGAKTVDGTLGLSQGGTGATDAAGARTNIDVYSKADADSRFLNVSGEASDVTMNGNTTIGDASSDTLTVNATADFNTGFNVDGTVTADALNVSAASPNIDVTDTGTSHASQDFLTNGNAVRATIGVERSAGGGLFIGSSPYAAVFGTASAGNTEFATNNNVRMTISSAGNVGIGTSSIYHDLQVTDTIKVATGNAQGILALGDGNGTTVNVGLWRGAANAPTTDGNYLNLGGYDGVVFATGAAAIGSQTERMRITTDKVQFNVDAKVDVDNARDLGAGGARWKDLHLSGSIEIENGSNNVGVGKTALNSNTGNGNTALGKQAGMANTTADHSTYIGYAAGETATGEKNTLIGQQAGYLITSGAKNSVIGRFSGNQGGLDIRTSSNNIVLSDGDGNPRLYIDSSGNVRIGNTGGAWPSVDGVILLEEGILQASLNNSASLYLNRGSSNGNIAQFARSSTTVGGISVTTTSTSFNTSSDHRLKENVVDLTGATNRLKQLEPKRFNFIADADTTVDGFLAHEVQSVVPEAISGTHNEVDDDGNPVYQGIDQSKLVPLLVATIKELEARITALENA